MVADWFAQKGPTRRDKLKTSVSLRYAGGVLLLAAIYFLAGVLGSLLSRLGALDVPIWPTAGIGLGALILFGRRYWPGIYLAACVLCGLFISRQQDIGWALLVPQAMLYATGSVIQAWVGAWLSERLFGRPITLSHPARFLQLLAVCGPLVCLVTPTFIFATQWALEGVDAARLPYGWTSLWLGQTFGVIVFLPLTLLGPWRPWTIQSRSRAVTGFTTITFMVVATLLILTFAGSALVESRTFEKNERAFTTLVHDHELALRDRLDAYRESLDGAAGLFQASDFVSAADWKAFVRELNIKENLPGINGMGIVRPLYGDGSPNALSRDSAADMTEREAAVFYIKFIEPLADNRQALGFNIASEQNRYEAAVLSRDTGRAAITRRIQLVQDAKSRPGFLLLRPMYRTGGVPDSVEKRRDEFQGWVFAPFIGEAFMSNLTNSQGELVRVSVHDGGEANDDNLIYRDPVDTVGQFEVRHTLSVMQQEWTVVWKSTAAFDKAVASREGRIVLAGGILLTIALATLLLALDRRQESIRQTVEQKTREVRTAYSQNKSIFDTAAMAIVLLDSEGTIISSNGYGEALFGYDAGELTGKSITQIIPDIDMPREQVLPETQRYTIANRLGKQLHLAIQLNRWSSENGEERLTAIIRDVTGEVEAKQALEKLERRWSQALEGSKLGVFDIDLTTGKSEVSPVWKTMIGFGPDENIDSQAEWMARVHPNDLPKVLEADRACIENRARRSLTEYRLQRRDGSWVWLRSDAVAAERDADGQALRLIGTMTDVTELKKASEALAASEQKFRRVIEDAPVGIVLASPDRRWRHINPALCETLGYTHDELYMRLPEELVHPDDVQYLLDGKPDQVLQDEIVSFQRELRFIHKNGEIRWMLNSVSLGHDPDGSAYFIVMFQEITELKKATAAVAASENKFRTVIEDAPVAMALTAPDRILLETNNAFRELFGYEKDELVGQPVQMLMRPEDVHTIEDGRAARLLRGEIRSFQRELRFVRKDGSVLWIINSVSLGQNIEGDKYLIVMFQDITERKEAERLKSDFIASVSHELRTPLTSIRGSLGLILGSLDYELTEGVKRLLSIAHSNSERLVLLVNDILDAEKMSSGQMKFEMEHRDAGELVRESIDANQGYADELEIRQELTGSLPVADIRVDPHRLHQVLANLLSNAVKFSPPGGTVRIRGDRRGKDTVRISVSDDGPGIPPEFRGRIFSRFAQADSSSTRAKNGTGLGLHLAKMIIEEMGGSIGFESVPGAGSTFWVEMPIAGSDKALEREDQAKSA